ncbi:cbb3-type cytochrome oxidase assembly protein CcoS [Sphingobium olei]|uniref:Cbb3-type cytochrome oxidase assembly protein CcoS n=1 Tax=Sphingobium olei TaxID=420955 RepID=A0ABW3P4R4_9SPHN
MTGLALLIPLALLCGLVALAAFFMALRTGQYDDLDGAAMRMLADGEED